MMVLRPKIHYLHVSINEENVDGYKPINHRIVKAFDLKITGFVIKATVFLIFILKFYSLNIRC